MNRKIIFISFFAVILGVSSFFITGLLFNKPSNSAPQVSASPIVQQKEITKQPTKDMASMPDMSNMEQNSVPLPPPELPSVDIPYEKQQLIGVQTSRVTIQPLSKVIRTVGRVTYDETKLSTVNTKFEGYIEKLYVNSTGQYVRKGQPLAEIYSPELLATQMEFINLIKWQHKDKTASSYKDDIDQMLVNDSQNVISAAKQRLRLYGITSMQVTNIEKTEQPKRTLTVYSPVSGYVIQKQALQGTKVEPGQALFDVADLSTVWILADIYEQDIPLVKSGQKAAISLSYFPGKTFISSIDYVYPTMDNATRTSKLRLTVSNRNGQLKPDMYTNVEVAVGLGKKIAVPDSAVINTGTKEIVYVDLGNGKFQQRQVITGQKANGMVEILKGINAGEVVSTSGNFLIDSEARLKGG